MNRREFTKSVASIPLFPLLPSLDNENGDTRRDDYWELSAAWMQDDWGRIVLIKNGEVKYDWEYTDYQLWQKCTLLNAHTVAECEYVADLFGLAIKDLYIDPPYFSSRFEDDRNEVHLQQGKYSDYEYTYYVETHDEDGLHGVEGGSDSIEALVNTVGEKINR